MSLWLNGEEVWVCPECQADWHAQEIPTEYLEAGYYGAWDGVSKRYYSRVIGISWNDRVQLWRCPDCGKEWPRGSG